MANPQIVLLHATSVAIEPVQVAFAESWPEAELVNLLDDGLSPARARHTDLTEGLIERFVALCRYGHQIGADGILATCSAFGPAIERAAAELPIPILKPNEAMFEEAVGCGNRIAMVITFPPAQPTMEAEFEEELSRIGSDASLTTVVVPEALTALRANDADTHNRRIAERAQELRAFDAVMLGQFSTARAAQALRAAIPTKVLTSPDAAVAKMKRIIEG